MKYFVVDAFTGVPFRGNPAGVCIVNEWPADAVMQNIAAENSLPETAFALQRGDAYDLRWFTPKTEVDLCGHATLGASYVITHFIRPEARKIEYHTNSGVLTVERDGEKYWMDFPARRAKPAVPKENLKDILGVTPLETYLSRDWLVLLESEEQVRHLNPDLAKMKAMDRSEGIIVTAKGEKYDFVSRCFYPKCGIDEDPVTGSAHCTLAPYWADKLHKTEMSAAQISERGGLLNCKLCGERVRVGGSAILYLSGEISL